MFSYVDPSIRAQLIAKHQLIDLDRAGREITEHGQPYISVLGPVTIPRLIHGREVPLEWYPFVRRMELAQVLEAASEVTDGASAAFRELLHANMSVNSVFALPGFRASREPLVRVHSCCLTGDIFGSMRCDCGPQLAAAFEQMLDAGEAIFVRGGECSTIQCRDRARFINISVPIDDLTPLLASDEDLSMTVVSTKNDALDLLIGYVSLLQARQKPLPDELGRVAAAHIRDLMAATIGADTDCDPQIGERGGVRVARLRAMGDKLDALTAEMRRQSEAGVVMPSALVEKSLVVIGDTIAPAPKDSALVTTFVERMAKVEGLDESLRTSLRDEAIEAVMTEVYPAYERMREALVEQRPLAAETADGVGRLADRAALYNGMLLPLTCPDK